MSRGERVAARMVELGWTVERQAAFIKTDQTQESAAPKFKALTPAQLQDMLNKAANLLGLQPEIMRGYYAEVYMYPESLVYAWGGRDEGSAVLINPTGGYLLLPADTPYWEALQQYRDGTRSTVT